MALPPSLIKKDDHLPDKEFFIGVVRDLCKGYGIDFTIMAAICETESNWNPYATRYEARFKYISEIQGYARVNHITVDTEKIQQMTSWGIGQIMGATARSMGYSGPLVRLCEPELGLEYACMYFKNNCDRFPSNDRKIAAYNAGSPRYDRHKLTNQVYVDLVMSKCKNYEEH